MPTRTGFIVVMPRAEGSRGRALAGKITVRTGAHTLQGGQVDRIEHLLLAQQEQRLNDLEARMKTLEDALAV
jgi:hypothetical protein